MLTSSRRRVAALCLIAGAASALTACASGSGGSSAGGKSADASGKLDGGGKEIVMFMPTQSNIYIAGDISGAQAAAKQYNYKLRIFQNNFDSSQQDQQVQQFLASNDKPALVVWWPSNAEAGLNDLRLLSRVAPVIQINQRVLDDAKPYVKAYVGVNDTALAEAAGKAALTARDAAVGDGMQLHSANGNLVEFRFPTGYLAGDDRSAGFTDATKSKPFNVLRSEPMTAGLDAQDGFNHASQVIPQYKDKGIDFVYAQNLDIANGVVKALEQNGLTPGQDVDVVAGNCSGNLENLENGKVSSAIVQPPLIEGALAIRIAAQYLATGKVDSGVETIPSDTTAPELTKTAPKSATYLPVTTLTKDNIDSLTIWGYSGAKLCSG